MEDRQEEHTVEENVFQEIAAPSYTASTFQTM